MLKQNFSKPKDKKTAERLNQPHQADLLQKEKDYQLLNEELEAQTAKIVKEAEVVMKEQESFLRKVDASQDIEKSAQKPQLFDTDIVDVISHDTDLLSIAAGGFENDNSDEEDFKFSFLSLKKNNSDSSMHSAQKSSRKNFAEHKKTTSSVSSARPNHEKSSATNHGLEGDVALLDAAAEMGSEAQIRFLKAKLRVLQEEMNNQTEQKRNDAEESRKLKMELKEARVECDRSRKNFNLQQMHIQKLKTAFEEEKKKSESYINQLHHVLKELDSLKREQKQNATSYNATEVRLNRANEEIDKLKAQLQIQKNVDKESTSREQREAEKLQMENKRLERLRYDTLAVMKKQQKLIGILKRQILHIEAAKLLSFTEDEFVKALDWSSK